ncbi:hypothetical protein CDAR_195601 [Caerostris darwini]|uniref:Uncharacterized protein n=1 Tax=Caerostris darwini TaxID=1538125 RepID=A0AAV4NDT7_9ARAC|nr:hypothetical protein CDAR_195601 [Caerostris darwini]
MARGGRIAGRLPGELICGLQLVFALFTKGEVGKPNEQRGLGRKASRCLESRFNGPVRGVYSILRAVDELKGPSDKFLGISAMLSKWSSKRFCTITVEQMDISRQAKSSSCRSNKMSKRLPMQSSE